MAFSPPLINLQFRCRIHFRWGMVAFEIGRTRGAVGRRWRCSRPVSPPVRFWSSFRAGDGGLPRSLPYLKTRQVHGCLLFGAGLSCFALFAVVSGLRWEMALSLCVSGHLRFRRSPYLLVVCAWSVQPIGDASLPRPPYERSWSRPWHNAALHVVIVQIRETMTQNPNAFAHVPKRVDTWRIRWVGSRVPTRCGAA